MLSKSHFIHVYVAKRGYYTENCLATYKHLQLFRLCRHDTVLWLHQKWCRVYWGGSRLPRHYCWSRESWNLQCHWNKWWRHPDTAPLPDNHGVKHQRPLPEAYLSKRKEVDDITSMLYGNQSWGSYSLGMEFYQFLLKILTRWNCIRSIQ